MIKKKKPTVGKPSLAQELQALKITTNLMAREMTTLKPMLQEQTKNFSVIQSTVDNLRNEINNDPDMIERREQPTINQEQLNQLYAAVNKIAAMAAAIDDTKKMMVKLTSKKIQKLDAKLTKLRVRLRRLEG